MRKFDKNTQIKIIKIILIIIWMAIVFRFSNQQGTDSSNTSRKVTLVITQIITGRNIDENSDFIHNVETVIRKLAHFMIYTIGGFLIMNYVYTAGKDEECIKKKILYSISLGAGYACTDELHQFFVPGRSARFFDVGIDTLGVIAGITIYLIIRKLLEVITKKDTQVKI